MKRSGFTDTAGQEPHSHSYTIDEYGNGNTRDTIGQGVPHSHRIVRKQVQPSGADNHTHKLGKGKPTVESAE